MLTDTELSRYYDLGLLWWEKSKIRRGSQRGWPDGLTAHGPVQSSPVCAWTVMPSVERHNKVLDIGCGRGSLFESSQPSGMWVSRCGTYRSFPDDSDTQEHIFSQRRLAGHLLRQGLFWCSGNLACPWAHGESACNYFQETSRALGWGHSCHRAVPSFGSFQVKFVSRHWFHLDLPRHLYHFTLATLTRCLNKAGFGSIAQKHFLSGAKFLFGLCSEPFHSVMPSTST